MMRLFSLFLIAVIPIFMGSCKYRSVMKEVERVELSYRNFDREYLIHLPENYDLKKSYPLIIVYHGIYSRAKAIAGFSQFNKLSDSTDFIVVYPQGHKRAWRIEKVGTEIMDEDPDEQGFILGMIDSLTKNYSIDQAKIFQCGISNGAYMAMFMTNNYPERFAGMALVCGNMALPFDDWYSNIQPSPVLFFGGTKDKLIPYNGGPLKEIVNTYGYPQTIDFWCDKNGCGPLTDSVLIDNDARDKTSVVYYYSRVNSKNPVELYKIIGGGHGWPGRGRDIKSVYLGKVSSEINTAEIIADFFLKL
jgi:polyhydroxybutyrate depolymerase